MSNPNCSITFDAKNALVSGINAAETVVLNVVLTSFDQSTRTDKVVNITKSGAQSSSKFYEEDTYAMTFIDLGTVTKPDLSTVALTTEYVEMFFRSVDNSEAFTITDLDDSDATVDVTLSKGTGWSRNRASSAFINKFNYSTTVRKAL